MADESSLGLMFDISADPAKALAAIETFAGGTAASLAGLQSTLAGTAASTAVNAEAMTAWGATADSLAVAFAGVAPVIESTAHQSTEARHALKELEDMMGIHVPRGINTFLTHISLVGGALAAAFSVVMVAGLVKVIAEQLPEAFEKLMGYLSGWDEAAKKAFSEEVKAADDLRATMDAYANILQKARNLGLEGSAAQVADLQMVKTEIAQTTSRIAELEVKANIQRASAKELQGEIENTADDTGMRLKVLAAQQQVFLDKAEELDKRSDVLRDKRQKLEEQLPMAEAKLREASRTEGEKAAKEATARLEKQSKEQDRENERRLKMDEDLTKQNQKNAEDRAKLILNEVQFKAKADADARISSQRGMDQELAAFHKGQDERVRDYIRTAQTAAKTAADRAKAEENFENVYENVYRVHQRFEERMARDKMRLNQQWVRGTMGALDAVGSALQGHHKLEVALTIAKAALRAGMEIAEAFAAAARHDYGASALHTKAAIAFAAIQAISTTVGAVAGGGSGGGGYGGASGAVGATAAGPAPAMAAGGAGHQGGNYHIIVMGDQQGAAHIAGMVDHAVRFQGVKLTASHAIRPTPAVG